MTNEFSLQNFVNILSTLIDDYFNKDESIKGRISDDLYRAKLHQYAEQACQDKVITTFEKEMFIACSGSIKQGYGD